MRAHPELHLLILVVIRHVVVADEVDDRAAGNRRFEDVGLRDQPRRELAAVASALDAEPVAVDPQISPYRGADGIEHVLRLVAVLIAKDRDQNGDEAQDVLYADRKSTRLNSS